MSKPTPCPEERQAPSRKSSGKLNMNLLAARLGNLTNPSSGQSKRMHGLSREGSFRKAPSRSSSSRQTSDGKMDPARQPLARSSNSRSNLMASIDPARQPLARSSNSRSNLIASNSRSNSTKNLSANNSRSNSKKKLLATNSRSNSKKNLMATNSRSNSRSNSKRNLLAEDDLDDILALVQDMKKTNLGGAVLQDFVTRKSKGEKLPDGYLLGDEDSERQQDEGPPIASISVPLSA